MKMTASMVLQHLSDRAAAVQKSRFAGLLAGKQPEVAQPVVAGRVYGHDRTIHNTEDLSVEVNAHGRVVAVWFRCQALPFHQSNVSWERCNEMRAAYRWSIPRLTAVHVVDDTPNTDTRKKI